MKVICTGKVLKRSQHKATNGKTYYSIVLEENGAKFPRPFEFSSEDATLFGPPDGFAGVGNVVTATAFANGYASEYVGKDGKKRTVYGVRFSLVDLADFAPTGATPVSAGVPDEQVADDVPF